MSGESDLRIFGEAGLGVCLQRRGSNQSLCVSIYASYLRARLVSAVPYAGRMFRGSIRI